MSLLRDTGINSRLQMLDIDLVQCTFESPCLRAVWQQAVLCCPPARWGWSRSAKATDLCSEMSTDVEKLDTASSS